MMGMTNKAATSSIQLMAMMPQKDVQAFSHTANAVWIDGLCGGGVFWVVVLV